MLRLVTTALVATAAIACATGAAAKEKFSFEGTASAGQVIELKFSDLWHHEQIGQITFEGGSLDFATLLSEATVLYVQFSRPRTFHDIDVYQECTAPDGMPCKQFSQLTATSLNFRTPNFYTEQTADWLLAEPLPPGKGSFNSWHHSVYSTLTVGFIPDGDGPVSYRISGYATAPEPATWALMIGGFGLAGASLRRRLPAARAG